MMKQMKGVAFLFSETGTEGGWWAMQEDGFVSQDGYWGYEGLRPLEDGDDFTVFDDNGSVLFHGVIHQDSTSGAIPRQVIRKGRLVNHRTWKQQCVGGWWVHWVQKGVAPDEWEKLFEAEKRCMVKREEKDSPESKPSETLAELIAYDQEVGLTAHVPAERIALLHGLTRSEYQEGWPKPMEPNGKVKKRRRKAVQQLAE